MKTIMAAALLPILLATVRAKTNQKDVVCDLSTREFTNKHPLVLKPIADTDDYEFDDPDDGDSMIFEPGQKVLFACPGTEFEGSENDLLNATCVAKKEFKRADGSQRKQSFADITCKKLPLSELRKDGTCAGNKSAFSVGFKMDTIFVKTMDICFDENIKSAVYVKHKITPRINGSQKNFPRTAFKRDEVFANVPVDAAYSRANQALVLGDRIGPDRYLARGHLAPRADYVFGAQQTATFHYANAIPQWQQFNAGNWLALESAIRKLAADRPAGLTVYTGTHGVYQAAGRSVYLSKDRAGRPAIPVPLLVWKVVYDEDAGSAVAFVGLNDPDQSDRRGNPADKACGTDVCARVRWVTFKPDAESGLMYCCAVDDLRKTIRTVPSLETASLLLS